MDNTVKPFLKKIGIFSLPGLINYVFFLKSYLCGFKWNFFNNLYGIYLFKTGFTGVFIPGDKLTIKLRRYCRSICMYAHTYWVVC